MFVSLPQALSHSEQCDTTKKNLYTFLNLTNLNLDPQQQPVATCTTQVCSILNVINT